MPKSKALINFINNSSRFFNVFKIIIPKNIGRNVLDFVINKNLKKGEPINSNDRETLKNFYKSDILKLEKLINRDLSNWYK